MVYPGEPQIPPHNSDFNYAAWVAGTRVTLANVPWNNDYRDVVRKDFNMNTYLDSMAAASPETVIENVSYAKLNEPIRLNIPFNKAMKYNYLRASNPLQPIDGDEQRDYYYFILAVNYLAPNTTEFVLQLDVWASFKNSVTFRSCYIERGHVGVANTKRFDSFGRDYLTIPDGLDLGSEYQVIAKRTQYIMELDGTNGGEDYNNSILVTSATDLLAADFGDADSPILHSAPGGILNGLPSGASYYIFKGAIHFFIWMASMKDKPWITQGIMSITMIPDITRYGLTGEGDYTDPTEAPTGRPRMLKHSLFTNWRSNSEILNNIPARYNYVKDKFLTSPYMMVELTTWSGTPIAVKPESWADANATVIERASLVPPNQRVEISPFKYNAKVGSGTDDAHPIVVPGDPNVGGDDNGDYIDFATMIANFPTFAIVNDGAISYLASNSNSIAFQHSQADWSQSKALRSNEVSYDQASGAIAAGAGQTGIGVTADALSTSISNLAGAQHGALQAAKDQITAAGVGAVTKGPIGLLGGVIGGGANSIASAAQNQISQQAANAQFAVRKMTALQSQQISAGQAGFVRDTNKSLSDYAARGDYEQTIAGINARVQDARLIQPTTSGQVGGETMNIIHGKFGFSARWKFIDQAAVRRIGEYWLRYGYPVSQFFTPPASMEAMSKFTYWKMSETYITGTLPESFKQAIRGIFEKGVTVWHTPSDIGTVDMATNVPNGGITL